MKVVVVGSGGREHGLAEVLGRSAEVLVTPGNPGIPGATPAPVEELVADGSVDLHGVVGVTAGASAPEELVEQVHCLVFELARITPQSQPAEAL